MQRVAPQHPAVPQSGLAYAVFRVNPAFAVPHALWLLAYTSVGFADIAGQIELVHAMMDHWQAILPEGRILRLPYEALVASQQAMTHRILEHVGLPWEPGVLKFHETIRSVQTASLGQVCAFMRTQAVRVGS